MPTISAMTLSDRGSPVVAHNFLPVKQEGEFTYFRSNGSTPLGDKTLRVRITALKSGARAVEVKLEVPVVVTETINGVSRSKRERISYVQATFTFPSDSSSQERADTVGMFADALKTANANMNAVLINNESFW